MQKGSNDTGEKLKEVLVRAEANDSSLHTADFEFTNSVLATSADASEIKLACQSIVKV